MTTRVVVVGAGYAGLAVAALLKRLKRSSVEIRILERQSQAAWKSARALPVGLWAPACEVLDHIGVRTKKLNPAEVPGGCYVNVAGKVLAEAPPHALQETPLSFFSSGGALLEAISEAQKLKVEYGCDAQEILGADGGGTASGRTRLKLTSADRAAQLFEADLVILAAGHDNDWGLAGVSASMGSNMAHPVLGTSAKPAKSRGYVVYRGVSEASLRPVFPAVAFQTWGPGVRFACVPLAQGSSWYATFSKQHPFAQVGGLQTGIVPAGPQTDTIVNSLRTAFKDWHEPIDELLQGTATLAVEEAVASSFPWKAAARGNRRTVRVGDCAFTYDPILAIGAGEAILEASSLASILTERLDRPNPHLDDLYVDQVRGVLASNQVARCRKLTALSDSAQFFGQTRWCKARDMAMGVAPGVVKRGLFGWSIRQLGR